MILIDFNPQILKYIYVYIYLPGFLKRCLLKICPFSPERHRNRVFMTPMSLETTRERKEKGAERGAKKKRTPGTHNFYIAYFGDSF